MFKYLVLVTALAAPTLAVAQEFIDPCELEQATYRLDRETPLMPEINPADPMEALSRMKQIPAGLSITIVGKTDVSGRAWYQVAVVSGGRVIDTGWVNCIALIGQRLQRAP